MKTLNLLLLILLFTSCGSRKVNLHTSDTKTSIKVDELETIKIKELELSKEQYSSMIQNILIRADSITTDKQGNTKLYNPVIKSEKEDNNQEIDKSKASDTKIDKRTSEDIDIEEGKKDKGVERKQYNWWYGLPLLAVIGLVIYVVIIVIKKYYANRLKDTF
ncbi:hypothetical protein HMPREF9711_03129 [Myroides odoratimimus CCUG 3837]|uniref:hypothetical protein n=1 Tax=Myroides odoratimimus TaxID=76832 RepID=UPI000280ACE0|nr:hypothetical protein [Myroides odoratimimus]EKB02667.1 hypothetical protein HMPREF9711_03129 [Myroides odoratimimus CCUG 3837]